MVGIRYGNDIPPPLCGSSILGKAKYERWGQAEMKTIDKIHPFRLVEAACQSRNGYNFKSLQLMLKYQLKALACKQNGTFRFNLNATHFVLPIIYISFW